MLKKIRLDKLYQFLILLFLLANTILVAQEQKLTFKIQSNPTDSDYWWLEKNNFGIKPANFDFRGNWELKTSKTTYAINILAQDDSEKIYLNESFIKHNFSDKTFLRMGRYYKDFGDYLNDSLSSGHILISHNARPMPKIGLVTSKKIKKFKKLTFDMGIAHGFFDKDDYYIRAPLLHEKFIYLHAKNKDYEFSIGFVHEAMWGGKTPELSFSRSLKEFGKIFISADGYEENGHQNAEGSHIGIWDFLVKKTNNKKSWKLYYQHIFEDTSGLRFANRFDGLWGFELENYIPNTTFLIEYLDTSSQFRNPPYVEELYYSNYQYRTGWSYNNYNLGNPYIIRTKIEDYPNWNVDSPNTVHFAVSGKLSSSYYQLMLSRRTNINDHFQYKVFVGKKIKKSVDVKLFLANYSRKIGTGIVISRSF